MQAATYKPDIWVRAKLGDSNTQFIGKIVGARNDGEGWFYNVTNGNSSDRPYSVAEEDIIEEL
jgi:hypothetical protein